MAKETAKPETSAFDKAVEKKESSASYEVIQVFRDIVDFNKIHKVGDKFTGTPERLQELSEANLIKIKQ